jgi:hypothetical protein
MDEKQIQVVETLLADGRSLGYIATRMNMLGMQVDRSAIQSYISTKLSVTSTLSEEEKKNSIVQGGSFSPDFQPSGSPSGREDQKSQSSFPDQKEEVESSSPSSAEELKTKYGDSINSDVPFDEENWLGEYFVSEEWKNSGLDIFELAVSTKSRINEISNSDVSEKINSNEKYLKELREVQRKYAPGASYEIQDIEALSATARSGGYAPPPNAIPMKTVVSDQETLNNQVDRLRKQYAGEAYADAVKEVGQELMESLPEAVRNNKEALEAITDKIYSATSLEGNSGINLDLDGNGTINDKNFLLEMFEAFGDGITSIPMGVAKGLLVEGVEIFQGTEAAQKISKAMQDGENADRARNRIHYETGWIESFENNDFTNGARQLSSQVIGAIPSVAAAMAPGGVYVMGFSAAGQANVDALSNPEYTSQGRLKAVLVAGVSDAISAKLNKFMFNRAAARAAQASQKLSFRKVLTGNSELKQLIKVEFAERGLAVSSEALEEYAVAVANDWATTTGRGKEWTFQWDKDEYLEAGTIGGIIGGGVSVGGSIVGNASTSARARAEKIKQEEISNLEDQAKKLDESANKAQGEASRSFRVQAQSARKRASELRKSRSKFYEIIQLRNPEAYKRYQQIDAEIETISLQLSKESTPESTKEALEASLDKLISDRITLDKGFSQESMSYTDEERSAVLYNSSEAYLKGVSDELSVSRQSLKELKESKKASDASIAIAEQSIRDLGNKRRRFNRLQKKHNELVKEREELDEDSDEAQETDDRLDRIAKKMAETTEMPVDTWGGLKAGSFLEIMDDVNERYLSQWTQDSIEQMENSVLTRDEIESKLRELDNFALLTGENPNASPVSRYRNARFNARAERFLLKNNLKFHKVVGRYGAGENSYLVEGMTRDQAAEFAGLMGQESVAHKDGLVQADGSIQAFDGEGPSFISEVDGDYFSAMKDAEGNVVAWQFGLSDSYQDAEGNTISEEEYRKRGEEVKTDLSDIEALIEEENKQGRDPGKNSVTPDNDQDGYLDVPKVGNSPNAQVGMGGLETNEEAQAVNNLQRLLDSLFNGRVKIRLYTDSSSADKVSETKLWGGLFTADGVIHINASQIRSNALFEGFEGGVKKTKTFQETLQEEVMHAIIGTQLTNFYNKHKRLAVGLEKALVSAAGRTNIEGFKERLTQKRDEYKNQKNPDSVVFEEVVIEFMSTIAANPDIKLGSLTKVMAGLNNMMSALSGKSAKGFALTNTWQVLSIAQKFSEAQSKGELFQFDVDQESDPQDQKASSRIVNPTKIPVEDDGKVRVKMNIPIYSYQRGLKKDIGSEQITKEFKDRWHFINWWKKATKMGDDSYYSGFKTLSGDEINVDTIKDYGSRASSRLSSIEDRIQDIVDSAVDDKIISKAVAHKARRRIKTPISKLLIEEKREGKDSERYRSIVSSLYQYEEYLHDLISKEADRRGIVPSYNADNERASARLMEHMMSSPGDPGYLPFLKLKRVMTFMTGKNPSDKSATHEVLRSWIVNNMSEMDEVSRVKFLAKSYLGDVGKERLKRFFGNEDPAEFFNAYNESSDKVLDEMLSDGRLVGNKEDLKMRLNFIMAFTSAQSTAPRNTELAFQILRYVNQNRLKTKPNQIVPIEVIHLIEGKKGVNIDGIDITLISPKARAGSGAQFRKLNSLLAGNPIRTKSKAAKNQAKKFVVSEGGFVNSDGSIKWESFLRLLLTPYGSKNRSVRKGKGFIHGLNTKTDGTVNREDHHYMGQELFSDKLGAWALNLSAGSFPGLKVNGRGLEDVVTIDTHVLNTMALVMGLPYDAKKLQQDGLVAVYKELYGVPEGSYVRNSQVLTDPAVGRDLIKRLNKEIFNAESEAEENRLKAIKAKAVSPEVTMGMKEKRAAAAIIVDAASALEITPAQLGQVLFADRQVTDYSSVGKREFKTQEYSTYSASIEKLLEDEIPSEMEESLSEASKEMEERASSRLLFPDENIQDAKDSPLHRQRSYEEGVRVRPNFVIDEEKVLGALSTDATSRRIMAKDSEVKEGQKVGVRLNLNVMKNTGVPVQTMHDKSASGEALRYAAAVTVKNPQLFVNQNARRKILTFQENKFPMASVNGEFLSDNLTQSDFSGVKAFFNPFKHNVFVDASGRPIKSAKEATIIGSTVYLRGDIEYYDFNDPVLTEGRSESQEQRAKRIKRGEKYEKALKRFEGYSKSQGIEFNNRQDLEEAYDNIPISSYVALDDSEVASNMEAAQERASARLKIRQTAGRSARVYTGDTRKKIVSNPNNYFTPQVLKDLKANLSAKTDAELIDIMTDDGLGRLSQRNDDLGVLAASEMINRAVARGDVESIPDIIEEAAAMGTTAGRILRHLRELRGSTPKGIEMIILKAIERKGNKISEEQKSRLQKMAADIFRLGAEHEELMKKAIAGEDVEAALKAKTKELKEVERQLETFCNATIERGWGEIGGLLIQGNLLTPMSQITNVGANMVNAIGKVAVDSIALPIERLVNIMGIDSPMKRNYSINAYLHGIRRFGVGFVEALDQIMTGQEADVTEWRMTRGFAPFRSIMSAIGKGDLPMGVDGKASINTRAKLFVQGSLGIPAEIMFRFLSLGDTPFRRYVEGIELYQAGRRQGLEGDALKNFLKYPSKKAREAAEAEGRKLTYQEETIASRTADDFVKFAERVTSRFFDWIPGTNGDAIARFLIRSNIPYRRTPANLLYDTLTFATPYVAVPRMMAELKDGDARSASQTLAKAMVGGMATQVTLALIREGLISGAIDFGDDEKKNIAYDQFPPSSINISGIKRWINGGDPAKQEDDYFFSYMKLGIIGSVMGSVVKGVDPAELKKRDYSGDQWVTHVIQDSFGVQAFSSIAHMMDQSFVQGMSNLVQVLSKGDERTFENWLGTTFQAMSATVLPNTMSAAYRAEREYLPDTRITKDMSFTERVLKKFEYTIKSRTFGLGELPVRRNWKGEKIEQTPRGSSGIMYQLFDITKARQGEADSVSNEIWRLFEQTELLTKACGTPGFAEKRKLNVPNINSRHLKALAEKSDKYTWMKDDEFMADAFYLNTEQMNRLMEVAGKQRYTAIESLMETEEYNSMNDEERIEALDDLNENYNGAVELKGGEFKNHTMVLFDIMQEVYDSER